MNTQTEMPLVRERPRMPYWRMYADDFMAGTIAMSFEEVGFYTRLLNAMWAARGVVPACERWLAANMRCDVRVARRLRNRLVSIGKISVEQGLIRQARMEREIAAAQAAVAKCGTLADDGPSAVPANFGPTSAGSVEETSTISTTADNPPHPTPSQDSSPPTPKRAPARGRGKGGLLIGLKEGGHAHVAEHLFAPLVAAGLCPPRSWDSPHETCSLIAAEVRDVPADALKAAARAIIEDRRYDFGTPASIRAAVTAAAPPVVARAVEAPDEAIPDIIADLPGVETMMPSARRFWAAARAGRLG